MPAETTVKTYLGQLIVAGMPRLWVRRSMWACACSAGSKRAVHST